MLRPDLRPVDLACLAHDIEASSQVHALLSNTWVTGVEIDSRLVRSGDLFVALAGHNGHGATFVGQALANGAAAVLTDPQAAQTLSTCPVPVIPVTRPRTRLGAIAAAIYHTSEGSPVRNGLRILAVTGTNGKTTATHFIAAGLVADGLVTGLIGTVGITVGTQHWPSPRTTPEAVHLHAALAAMAQQGVQAVALEASSHALVEGRLDGLVVDVAGFTNLTQDHLDYHGTMDAYFRAKSLLFTPEHARFGVIGIDDGYGRRLAGQTGITSQTWSAGDDRHASRDEADWRLVPADREGSPGESWMALGPSGERQALRVSLPGAFNRANALCAFAMLRSAGVDAQAAAAGIRRAEVPGRMQPVIVDPAQGIQAVVDYAHTPEAIARVLQALRAARIHPGQTGASPTGMLIAVVGAGGNRDRAKRPAMGAAAAQWADMVIVTDDNPRDEDPAMIRAAVMAGARQAGSGALILEVPDRAEAIRTAVQHGRAGSGSVVAVLGKGHEATQEVAGHMVPFDDRDHLAAAMAAALGGATSSHGTSHEVCP